jgi:hypothetical protein
MANREAISMNMNILDTIMKMSEGNLGAVRVLTELAKSPPNGFFMILNLDDMNIWGWQIWVGFNDYCKQNLQEFIKAIKNRDPAMVNMINKEGAQMKSPHVATTGGASFKRPANRP